MRQQFLLILFFLYVLPGTAQVTISVNPTGKHHDLIEAAKGGKHVFDHLKTQRNDSIRLIRADTSLTLKDRREQIKKVKKNYRISKEESKRRARSEVAKRTGVTLPDSIPYPPQTSEDSLKWALQVLASEGQFEEIRKAQEAYVLLALAKSDSLDKAAAQRSASIAESFLPEKLKSQQNDTPIPNSLLMDQFPDSVLPHKKLGTLLESAPEASVEGGVTSLTNLKSKYSEMPDLRYPDKAVKKNSMKGEGLGKRLVLGGSIAVQSTDPLTFDVDLQLGYRINKRWIAGTSLIWRETFGKTDTLSNTSPENAYGYGVFTRYDIKYGFFGYSEYSGLKNEALFSKIETVNATYWSYQWLLGVGSEIKLFKFVNLTMIMAYDLNHKNNDLHPHPLVFKLGYRFTKLPVPSKGKK